MKVYKLYFDTRIESKNAKEAEDKLVEQNGAGRVSYFFDEQNARREYDRIVSGLGKPMDLSGGLKWYEGVVLECGDADNDQAGKFPAEIFLNAYNYDILACSVKGDSKYAILRIDADGTPDRTLSADYNTDNYTVAELEEIAQEWTEEDADGTRYEVVEK